MVDQAEGSVPVNWFSTSCLNGIAARKLYELWRMLTANNSLQQVSA
jgi:hypothetical protein